MVSDETEQTVTKAMEMVKQVLPADAFYGNGPSVGPSAFMIDDSIVEHTALSGHLHASFSVPFISCKGDGHGFMKVKIAYKKKTVSHSYN